LKVYNSAIATNEKKLPVIYTNYGKRKNADKVEKHILRSAEYTSMQS